ncbi:MAG: site-specific DNA-methyltransferase, partial [bacterium]|nr:site-specific DNA-methyltransferase [bacterium]
ASIYLHIDYKIGHYVKVLMDEVFGINNFRNDITRIKCNPKNFSRKAFGNIKDLVLFYSKTDEYIWNDPKRTLNEDDLKRLYKKVDNNGRYYTTVPLHAPGETRDGPTGKPWRDMLPPKGRHWRCDPKKLEELDKSGLIEWSSNGVPRKIIYAEDAKENGVRLQDILEYKDSQTPSYPTEKNIEFLKLLINTSSDSDSIVLDSFCGSGTTLVAAKEMGRHWIGIDESKHAIEVAQKRIDKTPNDMFTANYELLSSKELYEQKSNDKTSKHKMEIYNKRMYAG